MLNSDEFLEEILHANEGLDPSAFPAGAFNGRPYVVEGDLLLDEPALSEYTNRVNNRISFLRGIDAVEGLGAQREPQLLCHMHNGAPALWNKRTIRYCVQRCTFHLPDNHGQAIGEYELICENFAKAAHEWNQVCGLKFDHAREHDLETEFRIVPECVDFAVLRLHQAGYYAIAFFPNQPHDMRRVYVCNDYFINPRSFDLVGVFRHELGHVLGLEHMNRHIQAPVQCRGNQTVLPEEGEFIKDSVMWNPCLVASMQYGSRNFVIQSADARAALRMYPKELT